MDVLAANRPRSSLGTETAELQREGRYGGSIPPGSWTDVMSFTQEGSSGPRVGAVHFVVGGGGGAQS